METTEFEAQQNGKDSDNSSDKMDYYMQKLELKNVSKKSKVIESKLVVETKSKSDQRQTISNFIKQEFEEEETYE